MASENKRYRFAVPPEDKSVHEWIVKQNSLSVSLRLLIGDTIERYGYIDYSCKERIPNSKCEQAGTVVTSGSQDIGSSFIKQTGHSVNDIDEIMDSDTKYRAVKRVEPAKPAKQTVSAQQSVAGDTHGNDSDTMSENDIYNLFKK